MKRLSNHRLVLSALLTIGLCLTAGRATATAVENPQPTTTIPSGTRALNPPLRLGSWGQTIKKASTTPTDTAYDEDDITAYIEALEETGQNFLIYDINSDRDWSELLELLDALKAKGSGMQVVAAMNSPYLGSNRWVPASVANINSGTGCGIERWKYDHDILMHWLDAWCAAASNCSRVAVSQPNLFGITVDDFNRFVETAAYPAALYGARLKTDEIQRISDAAHSVKSDFKFMPVMYYGDDNIAKGYILGSNYGVHLFTDEEMVVALSFYLDGNPLYGALELFHADTSTNCNAVAVYKRILVNTDPVPVWEESIGGDQGVAHVQTLIPLKSGLNTIYLVLKPTANFNGYAEVFWKVWDVSVSGVAWRTVSPFGVPELFSFSNSDFNESFHVKLHTTPYYPYEGSLAMGLPETTKILMTNTDTRIPPGFPAEVLPNDSVNGLLTHRLIAGRNRDYLLREVVDGMICTSTRAYTIAPASMTCTGVTVPLWTYDAADYQALVESTKAHWSGRTYVALHHSMLTGTWIDPDILTNQLAIAAGIADATAVWNWPIGVHYLDEKRGIFAQSLSDDMDYSLMAFWPGRQFDLPGWCQRWVLSGYTGDLTISMRDNRDVGISTGILFKNLYIGGAPATLYGPQDVSSDGTTESSEIKVSLKPGENLVLSVDLGGGAGDWSTKVYFKVKDAKGNFMPYSRFTYRTGLNDPTALTVYQKVRDQFVGLR